MYEDDVFVTDAYEGDAMVPMDAEDNSDDVMAQDVSVHEVCISDSNTLPANEAEAIPAFSSKLDETEMARPSDGTPLSFAFDTADVGISFSELPTQDDFPDEGNG